MKTTLYKAIYRLLGAGSILGGLGTFLMMFGFFPEQAATLYADKVHLLQEFGCAMVFMGMVALWFSSNLAKGRTISLMFVIYFALLALVHWIDFFKDNVPLMSPAINMVPVVAMGVLHLYYDFDRTAKAD